MATIKARKHANGALRHTAIVRIRQGKTILYRESKTFAFRAAALSWAKHREVELEKPGALDQVQKQDFSLGALIRWYIDTFCEISNWQRTKQTSLEFLENHSISAVRVQRLTTAMLIDHIRTDIISRAIADRLEVDKVIISERARSRNLFGQTDAS